MKKIILASASERRRDILKTAGLDPAVMPSNAEEDIDITDPRKLVEELSRLKAGDVAGAVSADEKDALVIGADTIVYFGGKILGKPADKDDAFNMLKAMSGKTHTVFTGVTIIDVDTGRNKTFHEETGVHFYTVSDEEITEYIATGDPMDKAGSYGVQSLGAFLVKGIEGDFYNVVGLPLARLLRELKNLN